MTHEQLMAVFVCGVGVGFVAGVGVVWEWLRQVPTRDERAKRGIR